MKKLSGKQLRYLRAKGNKVKPTVHVGKDGIYEALIQSLGNAFNNHELIKIRIERGCTMGKDEVSKKLATATSAHLVQVLGNTCLLFKQDPDKPVIELP